MSVQADLSDEELGLFSTRVERGLASRPLALEPELHRQIVADLVSRVGNASFYDLLDLGPGATDAEVYEAYERLARIVHPSHARCLGLSGKEGVLKLLFERATQAYLTLSHPDRRKEYDGDLDSESWQPGPRGESREEEERQVARRYYIKASILAASEEYHLAIELLRLAARVDPQADYYALLGQLEAKNPHWLRLAEASLERALELGGGNRAVELALARVRGQKDVAATAGDGTSKEEAPPPSGLKRLFKR
ncbi:MAG TPA: DnaJ domain-containing protein [Thermoanaerobaculia bacterium]|nr:DnaJ domain-containing protein [Thermoanaerobaculia bacterium]